MWDSTLLAYADRSRIVPPEYRRLVMRSNGDVLPTVLVDGDAAGVWHPIVGGIEVSAFPPTVQRCLKSLDVEARDLRAFLADLQPNVYNRYERWFGTFPSAEIRAIGR